MVATPHRTALVTGASSGLGEALCRRLAARGTKVFAAARTEAKLAALADAFPGLIEPVVLDVTDTDACVRTLRALDADGDGLELIIASAGLAGGPHAAEVTWEGDIEPVLRTNTMGALATLTAVLPEMVARDQGHLVGISSLAARAGLPAMAAYSASKAMVSTFLETLRVDLEGTGVTVTTIEPGHFVSPLVATREAPMAFLVTLDEAADEVMKAIDKKARVHAFPAPMAAASGFARLLPRAIYDRLVKGAAEKGFG